MKSALHQARTQLRENVRLRLGGWAIVFVLLLNAALLLKDRNNELESRYLEQADKLHRLEVVSDAKKWQERAQETKNIWTDELKRFPLIKSQGVTRAGVENNLNTMISQLGIDKTRLQLEEFRDISELPGILQLTAKIEGQFVPEKLVKLVYELENQQQRGQLVKLQIVRGGNSRFELIYGFYFQADRPAEGQGGS